KDAGEAFKIAAQVAAEETGIRDPVSIRRQHSFFVLQIDPLLDINARLGSFKRKLGKPEEKDRICLIRAGSVQYVGHDAEELGIPVQCAVYYGRMAVFGISPDFAQLIEGFCLQICKLRYLDAGAFKELVVAVTARGFGGGER